MTVLLNRTEMWKSLMLATARSGSPVAVEGRETATITGPTPAAKSCLVANDELPAPGAVLVSITLRHYCPKCSL